MDLRAVLERVLPAVRAPRARGWQGEGEGRAHQLLRARHGGNPVPVLRRRTRCRASASSISPRFRGRTRGEPFGEGDHAVSRPNSRSRARRRALHVADGRGVFSYRRVKHAVRSFSVFRKCFLVGVSCRASDEKGLCRCPRAGIHAMRRARVAGGRARAAGRRWAHPRTGLRVRARSPVPDATHARLDRPHPLRFRVGHHGDSFTTAGKSWFFPERFRHARSRTRETKGRGGFFFGCFRCVFGVRARRETALNDGFPDGFPPSPPSLSL